MIVGSMNKTFLKSVLVLSVLMLVSCERYEVNIDRIIDRVHSLFDLNDVTKKDLKNLWLPLLRAIENVNLSNISNEDEIISACHLFSNSLKLAAKKLFVEKQDDSTKELLLHVSTRIMNFSRRLRDIAVKHKWKKTMTDTFWLIVSYNDNELNVWSLVNSIVFDSCDNIEVVEYYLSEIAERLNESVDNNVYFNILGEIEEDTPDLINKLLETVQRLGGVEKIMDPTAKKVFNYIDLRVKERKSKKS